MSPYTDPTQRHEPAPARGPIVAAVAFVAVQVAVVVIGIACTVGGPQ